MSDPMIASARRTADLGTLLNPSVRVAGDVIEVGAGAWAIHAEVPYDGAVLIEIYDTLSAAHAVLALIPCPRQSVA